MSKQYDFKYVPTSGPISGQSVLSQTEQALNELGQTSFDTLEIAKNAMTIANQAASNAVSAITTANEALAVAGNAASDARSAIDTANSAVSSAQDAIDRANTAIDNAANAQTRSDEALRLANEALNAANTAQTTANDAAEEAQKALTIATSTSLAFNNSLYYQPPFTDQPFRVDELAESAKYFIEDASLEHLPVAEKGFLTIASQAEETGVSTFHSRQQYTTLSGVDYVRTGIVTVNSEDGSVSVVWEDWTLFRPASHASETADYGVAGDTLYGHVKLSDSTGSTSDTTGGVAATPKAVKAAHDLAQQAFDGLDTKQDTLTFDATPTAGSSNPVTSGGVKSAIDSAISTVYKWKGSVDTVSDLPASGNAVGDVYNVVSSGANYGWTGTNWDNLGGIDAVDAVPVKDSAYPVASGGVFDALATKQDKLTIDAAPVTGSTNPVASGGVADALSKIQESLVFDDTPTAGSTNPVTSQGIKTALDQLAVNGAGAPVGTIQYFAMDAPPTGYLKADGTLVSRTVYADLFTAIGTTYGVGDGTTTFALPDLRGEFVRGFDDGRGVDSSRVFGSTQGDAQYPLSDQRITQLERFPATDPVTTADAAAFGYRLETSPQTSSHPDLSVCAFAAEEGDTIALVDLVPFNTNPVADEVRPRNVALLACIKAFGVIDNTGSVDLSTLASKDEVAKKQDKLTFDTAPTENSANPVTSGGVYTAIQNSVNAVDLSGYWATGVADKGVTDRSYLETTPQTLTATSFSLDTQSESFIQLNVSGNCSLVVSDTGSGTRAKFITLSLTSQSTASVTWPDTIHWIDASGAAPVWGNASQRLIVELALVNGTALASTLYNSEE